MTHEYHIATDDGQMTTQAETLSEALAEFGAPATDAAGFERWLRKCGGYGHISQDDVVIVTVSR